MVNEGDLSGTLPITDTKELRDSGISINENRYEIKSVQICSSCKSPFSSTNMNSFNNHNNNCYEDFELRPHPSESSVQTPPEQCDAKEEHPPPIPPKVGGNLNSSLDFGGNKILLILNLD